jgi:hypothetical protein
MENTVGFFKSEIGGVFNTFDLLKFYTGKER